MRAIVADIGFRIKTVIFPRSRSIVLYDTWRRVEPKIKILRRKPAIRAFIRFVAYLLPAFGTIEQSHFYSLIQIFLHK